jgi:hypothetical protein
MVALPIFASSFVSFVRGSLFVWPAMVFAVDFLLEKACAVYVHSVHGGRYLSVIVAHYISLFSHLLSAEIIALIHCALKFWSWCSDCMLLHVKVSKLLYCAGTG